MSKKDNKKEKHEVPVQDQPETELAQEQVVQNETDSEQVQSEQAQSEQTEQAKTKPEEPSAKDQLAQQEDKFLRLALGRSEGRHGHCVSAGVRQSGAGAEAAHRR